MCVRCHKPFVPASNRQRYCAACGAEVKKVRSREKQRRYRERQKTALYMGKSTFLQMWGYFIIILAVNIRGRTFTCKNCAMLGTQKRSFLF
jgi:hypothetical protein